MHLSACGPARVGAADDGASPAREAVVEERLPVARDAGPMGAATPIGQVRSAMQAGPVATGIAPITSNMPPLSAIAPPAAYAPPATAPQAAGGAEDPVDVTEPVAASPRPREVVTSGQICAAAVGMLFGRDPADMQVVSDAGGFARIKYRRSDQTTWTNECRVTDRGVTWRAIGADGLGRWRTEDEITYTASTTGLAMTVNGETRAFAR